MWLVAHLSYNIQVLEHFQVAPVSIHYHQHQLQQVLKEQEV
jgi:hypothetical protein